MAELGEMGTEASNPRQSNLLFKADLLAHSKLTDDDIEPIWEGHMKVIKAYIYSYERKLDERIGEHGRCAQKLLEAKDELCKTKKQLKEYEKDRPNILRETREESERANNYQRQLRELRNTIKDMESNQTNTTSLELAQWVDDYNTLSAEHNFAKDELDYIKCELEQQIKENSKLKADHEADISVWKETCYMWENIKALREFHRTFEEMDGQGRGTNDEECKNKENGEDGNEEVETDGEYLEDVPSDSEVSAAEEKCTFTGW